MDIPCERLVLTGFMGTGKSTSGRHVARLLNWSFVDTDQQIERYTRRTVREIFDRDGEPVFRAYERSILVDLLRRPRLVIATGGGMLVSAVSRKRALTHALVICLEARPEVLERRLSSTRARPLASDWRSVVEARRSVYASLPNHVDTSDRDAAEVAEEIAALCQSAR